MEAKRVEELKEDIRMRTERLPVILWDALKAVLRGKQKQR